MQIQIFTLPLLAEGKQIEELNHFLRASKVIDIRKELALLGGNHVWTFCVTYMADGVAQYGRSGKVDYREVLDENTFKIFSLLRKARKAISESEGLPAYAVFTDAELAEIAQMDSPSGEGIQAQKSIGKKRSEKYASLLLSKADEIRASEEPRNETDGIFA